MVVGSNGLSRDVRWDALLDFGRPSSRKVHVESWDKIMRWNISDRQNLTNMLFDATWANNCIMNIVRIVKIRQELIFTFHAYESNLYCNYVADLWLSKRRRRHEGMVCKRKHQTGLIRAFKYKTLNNKVTSVVWMNNADWPYHRRMHSNADRPGKM